MEVLWSEIVGYAGVAGAIAEAVMQDKQLGGDHGSQFVKAELERRSVRGVCKRAFNKTAVIEVRSCSCDGIAVD